MHNQTTTARPQPYVVDGNKVLIEYSSVFCETPTRLLDSDLFRDILTRFLAKLEKKGSPLYTMITDTTPANFKGRETDFLVNLFRMLVTFNAKEVAEQVPDYSPILNRNAELAAFREELYNFWRRFERFAWMEVPNRPTEVKGDIHYAQFVTTNQELKDLVLLTSRRISENLTGYTPRVYRQLPAWINMGMLVRKLDWDCPPSLARLKDIPFVRHILIEPPVILYPQSNTRKGSFTEIPSIPDSAIPAPSRDWFCIPLKVADLTAFVYFKKDFISLALSMGNLFELVGKEGIKGKRPDLVIIFGADPGSMKEDTGFHYLKDEGLHVGIVKDDPSHDYFGYFKKMTLTLHNLEMIRRGSMPIHGAMVALQLAGGGRANVVVVGDSGAGKSETLEALRGLAEGHIIDMKIIFDDMGSLRVGDDGKVIGFGTEIGAFVRLDDLSPGYAYEEIDRSIFMNPHKKNARLIIPVSAYETVVKGYPVDFFLYANNYDGVDSDNPAIDFFNDYRTAEEVFRSGARMAKGTTDEKGLVHTYFANPFGAPQRRKEHEHIAEGFFKRMFETGVKVGQIRTRLGIEGMELDGPKEAGLSLFEVIKSHREK